MPTEYGDLTVRYAKERGLRVRFARTLIAVNRRQLLGGLTAASVLSLLGGCTEDQIKGVLDTCPSDPAETAGITWTPDIGRPLFWGVQTLGAAQGAPRNMLVYYPTVDGSTDAPPIHKRCVTRWPVVLFLHGQPPSGQSTTDYHKKWFLLPATLARCGYVVVVPNHEAQLPLTDFAVPVQKALADINFVRTGWSESNWVHKQPEFTAVIGHSYGALLGARVAAALPSLGAYMGLSGPFAELNDAREALQAITAPSFLMWAKGPAFEDLDTIGGAANPSIWEGLSQSKYAAVFKGEHFDYLRAQDVGDAPRGPCDMISSAAADLAALFVTANVRVPLATTQVPVDLQPPQVQLTQEQQFFAGGHLSGIKGIQTRAGCRIDLRWKVDGAAGSRKLGP